jgi:hypothetical protein
MQQHAMRPSHVDAMRPSHVDAMRPSNLDMGSAHAFAHQQSFMAANGQQYPVAISPMNVPRAMDAGQSTFPRHHPTVSPMRQQQQTPRGLQTPPQQPGSFMVSGNTMVAPSTPLISFAPQGVVFPYEDPTGMLHDEEHTLIVQGPPNNTVQLVNPAGQVVLSW